MFLEQKVGKENKNNISLEILQLILNVLKDSFKEINFKGRSSSDSDFCEPSSDTGVDFSNLLGGFAVNNLKALHSTLILILKVQT